MRRLQRLDRLLFWTLVPLWLGFATAHGVNLVRFGNVLTIPGVSRSLPEARQEYAKVLGVERGSAAEAAGLRPGDLEVRVGPTDLRGATEWQSAAAYMAEVRATGRPVAVFQRPGSGEEFRVRFEFERQWQLLLLSLGFAASAIALLLRARPSRLARSYFAAAMIHAIWWTQGGYSLPSVLSIQPWSTTATAALAWPLFLRSALLLPEAGSDRRRVPSWIWLFALPGIIRYGGSMMILPASTLGLINRVVVPIGGILFVVALLTAMTRGYLRSDAIGRRQMKWIVLGAYVGTLPGAAWAAAAFLRGQAGPDLLPPAAEAAFIAVPISFLIAMTRYNLLDIDRLLSVTATWTMLGIALVAGLLIIVPRAAAALSEAMSLDPAFSQAVLSLVLAVTIVPAARWARPLLDQILFAERHALDQGIGELAAELEEGGAAEELFTLLGKRLDEVVRPESCAIYGQAGEVFAPLFARGGTLTPAFASSGGLVAALQRRRRAFEVGRWLASRDSEVEAVESAELAAVALVVPIRRGPDLVAFVCLGSKRSGDVYTAADRALLDAAAVKLGAELQRVNEAELLRMREDMVQQLRLYVPGAIATQLESGAALEPREREVAILFVDLRGYTTFSEGRPATEIFHAVNRTTEAISGVVGRHGGSVVEFNGDGMMVVFGAPVELPDKERAAVSAAREIMEALASIQPQGGGEPLAAGIGIATGAAFVGNIRSVDRYIWSAVGNTTNLAARLQALTRDLDALVVIDAVTWRRASDAAADFTALPATPIRGLREPVDVYVLPLRISSSRRS